MKTKLTLKNKRVLLLIGAMTGLVTLSFNCAPNMFTSAKYFSSNTSVQNFGAVNSPWVLFTSNQQFQSMLNVTGQGTSMTSSQKAEYDLRSGALSGTDNIAGINGPLLIGATSLAGEVCNGLIAKEIALGDPTLRTFFPGVDFTQPLSVNKAEAYTATMTIMAQAFYGRDLTAEESQALTAYYTDFVANIPADTSAQTGALYLSLCSAMLSSFDSMTY